MLVEGVVVLAPLAGLADQEQYVDADEIMGGIPYAMVHDNGLDHKLGLKGLRDYLRLEARPEARFGTRGTHGFVFTSLPHQKDNRNYNQKIMFDLPGTRQYDPETFEKNLHRFGTAKWYGFALSPRTPGPERKESVLFQTWLQGTSRAAAIKLTYQFDGNRGTNVLRFVHHVDNPSDRRPLPKVLASVDLRTEHWYKILLKIDPNHSGMPGSGHLQFWFADCGPREADGGDADWDAGYEMLADVKGDTIQNLVHEKLMIEKQDVEGFAANPAASTDPDAAQRVVWTTVGIYHPCMHERTLEVFFDEIRVGDSREEVDPYRSCVADDLQKHAARYRKAPMAPWKEWSGNADARTRIGRYPHLYADLELSDAGKEFLKEKYVSEANFERGRFDGSWLTKDEFRKWREKR